MSQYKASGVALVVSPILSVVLDACCVSLSQPLLLHPLNTETKTVILFSFMNFVCKKKKSPVKIGSEPIFDFSLSLGATQLF